MNTQDKIKFKLWIKTSISQLPKFNDIHIDEIDKEPFPHETWIEKGLSILKVAQKIKKHQKLKCDLSLAVPLQVENFSNTLLIISKDDLFNELDELTPPSIYIFNDFRSVIKSEKMSKINIEFLNQMKLMTFYSMFKSPRSTEYSRTLWILEKRDKREQVI